MSGNDSDEDLYLQQTVNVGMFGLGTVGEGVVRYLRGQYDIRKTGVKIKITRICVRDHNKPRGIVDRELLTDNPDDILKDPTIDVVVEVMGGLEPAGPIICEALRKGKHVVTANKAFLAYPANLGGPYLSLEASGELLKKRKWPSDMGGWSAFIGALSGKRNIGFEASVCGEIPIIEVISSLPSNSDINGLEGILNGTCNFILTRMDEGIDYSDALKQAQKKGFAEANPSFDVDGHDAAQKLAILASLIFGYRVEVPQITRESITPIAPEDIRHARAFGYKIKQLALARRHAPEVLELRVGPTLVPYAADVLASVGDEDNAVSLYLHEREKPLTFIGKGAGMTPTARSVVKDIVAVVKTNPESRKFIYNLFTDGPRDFSEHQGKFPSRWYLRLTAEDKPGVLGVVTTILGNYGISISSLYQEGKEGTNTHVPIAMLLHPATENNLKAACQEIRSTPASYVVDHLVMRVKN